ncbi:MAG: Na+/H+ antiporter subunit E [Rubrimonas sp.]|uniref:Na+/H+ antiporter subunit E n=1 Tax=Rubrimonas sp. TaxID=2036015 RepID=UPI002FDDF4E3
MTLLPLNLMIALAWGVASGDFSASNLLLGFVAGFIALYAFDAVKGDHSYHRRTLAALGLALYFTYDLVASSVQVAWAVLFPSRAIQPRFVEVELDAESDVAIMLIANLTSLTPGTLSVDVSADRRRLLIHAMFADDPQGVIDGVKRGLEPRVRRVVE